MVDQVSFTETHVIQFCSISKTEQLSVIKQIELNIFQLFRSVHRFLGQ